MSLQYKRSQLVGCLGGVAYVLLGCSPGVTASAQSLAEHAPAGYVLSWQDPFDTFDPGNWSRGLESDASDATVIWNPKTGGPGLLNDGYCSYIIDDDAYVEDGKLVLRGQKRQVQGTAPEGVFEYTAGWVNSLNKRFVNGTQRGVYIEIRAKFPSGRKVWPAIWMVSETRHWPPEIDIWEYFGTYWNGNDKMYMRYIYPKSDTQRWKKENIGDASTPINGFDETYDCEAWHVYGYTWTDQHMAWSIDGVEVHRLHREPIDAYWPDEDFCLILNNAAATKAPDLDTVWPNYLVIDYLAVWEAQ
ncbi:MAG: glycoside hydrolase family 16 protein [Planctomycetota bacterium]